MNIKDCSTENMLVCNDKFVTWKIFIWAIALITITVGMFFGWILTIKAGTDSKVDAIQVQSMDVSKELVKLQTIINERIPQKNN